ncbi:MAG: hypothetical protein PHR77_04920 [Kiritimatiellae bacterium]|nr:hypothetical protein [Kiritimatiellia bacterium]MDD5523006.1 hypothetical protein [Kiritimatiellia bacterium]
MVYYLPSDWSRLFLIVHLMVSVFAIGAATHHWWLVIHRGSSLVRLYRFAIWMAFGYSLALLLGILIYPSYNVLVRKPPLGVLENSASWAVGLFEIKEHLGSIALAMLPWLILSARYYEQLGRLQRVSYMAATWLFTVFVYYVFISGALVTTIKTF